jgi:hypothetical protein
MTRQVSSTLSCRENRTLLPVIAACSRTSYGAGPSPPSSANSMSSSIGAIRATSARCASTFIRTPVDGSSFTTSWFGSDRCPGGPNPSRGGRLNTSRSSVCVTGSRLPVRMKNGTPAQRQFSMSSRRAAYVSVVEPAATPSMPR